MKRILQIILLILTSLACTSCLRPATHQQDAIFRIEMVDTASGTQITLDHKEMSLDEIRRTLSAKTTTQDHPQVVVLIDPKVPMARFFDAMDMLREIGMDESASILKWGNPEDALIIPDDQPSTGINTNGVYIEII